MTVNPYAVPIPGHKSFWEARTTEEWEIVYLRRIVGGKPRLDTLSDLVIGREHFRAGIGARGLWEQHYLNDILDWHDARGRIVRTATTAPYDWKSVLILRRICPPRV